MAIEKLSDVELHRGVKELKGQENFVVAEIVRHLAEIDKRGIYRDAGYSSLFTYCRECLGYSEGSSGRRVRAARALKESPEIFELIRDGKLSLCAIAEVAPVISTENKAIVLEKAQGASKREAEVIAVQFGAPVKPKRECIKPRLVATPPVELEDAKVEERFSFSFEVTKEVRELYEEARELIGPCPIAEVFEKALKEFVQKRRPKEVKRTPPEECSGRYIPRKTVREVRVRDGGQCTYVSPEGKRCSERCGLQFDHILPFAWGGKSSSENLRRLCPAHNQLAAEKSFGKEFILKKRGGGSIHRDSPGELSQLALTW